MGDRDITVREDKAVPPKSAPVKASGGKSNAGASSATAPAADGCRVYVGNLAWETTEEELIGARAARASAFAPRLRPRAAAAGNPTNPTARRLAPAARRAGPPRRC